MASGKQLSFQYGEVSPSLRFRSDAVSYSAGLSKLKNMYVRRAGGVSNRPGFEFIKLSESQYDIPAAGAPAGIKGFTYWDPLKQNWITIEYGKFLNPDTGNPELAFKYTTGNDYSGSYSSIISGADGALTILSGATVDIPEGSVKQYTSINIESGGTLRITGGTGAWTEIGCSGDCVIDGKILAQTSYAAGSVSHSGGTFTKTSAFGLGELSYTINQAAGGKGGSAGGLGGNQKNGNGGGGSGYGNASVGNGGDGESNGQAGYNTGGLANITKGNGASATNKNGAAGGGGGGGGGGLLMNGLDIIAYGGGGGGGGYRGAHGKGLVLYVEGNISGSGSVSVAGEDGFIGGNGYSGTTFGKGAGGGGGAGGSGGSVIVKYRNGTIPSIDYLKGIGGAGGSLSTPTVAGASGSPGYDGTASIEAMGGIGFTAAKIVKPSPEEIKYTVLKESVFITPNVVIDTGTMIVPFNFLIKKNSLQEIKPFGYGGSFVANTLGGIGTANTGAYKTTCSYLATAISKDGQEHFLSELRGVPATGPWYPNVDISNKLTITFTIEPTDIKAVRLYRASGGSESTNFFYRLAGQAPYTSGTTVTISDYGAEDVTQTPPLDESAFNVQSLRNFISAAYYQQRLIASTKPEIEGPFISDTLKSGDLIASKLGVPEQLSFPTIYNDTGAFQFSIPITDGTPVIALLAMERLMAFTQRGVYVIRGSDSTGAVLTPTQINPFLISEEGCSTTVEPKMAGRRGYFINNSHTKLMAIEFGDDANLTIKEASTFSDHVLLEDICQIEVLSGGEDTLFLLRRDGKLVRITITEEGAHGFSIIETDGFIESVYRGKAKSIYGKNLVSTATVDRYKDVLMAYIIRNGKRFLERLTFRDDVNKEGEFFADCFGVFGSRLCYNGISGYTRVRVPYPFNGGDLVKDIYNVRINIPSTVSYDANTPSAIWCSGLAGQIGATDGVLHFYYEDETGKTQTLRFISDWSTSAFATGNVDFPQGFTGYFTSDVPEILQDANGKDLTVAEKNKLLTRWLPAFNVITGGSLSGVANALFDDPTSLTEEQAPIAVNCEGKVLSSPNNPDMPTLTLNKDAIGETWIDLPDYYSYGHFGIPYESDFETLDLEASDNRTFTDTRKLINAVGVAFNETRGGYFGIEDADLSNMAPISPTNYSPFNNQSELDNFNGHISIPIPTNWSERGRVRIRQVDPLPMTILSVYPKGVAGD